MKKMLLHTCCGPCAIYVAQQLAKEYDLTLFFYNPNIHPDTEYKKRYDEIVAWARQENIKLIEGDYDVVNWFKEIKGLENESEGGARCAVCFRIRLTKTAEYAKQNSYDIFATTLSISPHKKASIINEAGEQLCKDFNIEYLSADWKKNDGFKIACQLAAAQGFYRQEYCGCTFSYQERLNKIKTKANESKRI